MAKSKSGKESDTAPAEDEQETAAEAASEGAAGGGQKPAPTVASVLGEICWLFARTPSHRYFFMTDLEWLVLPAVMKRQFRIYRNENGQPIGVVLWAKLNQEAEERLLAGSARLRPNDWDGGDRHWIIDVVDISGGQRAQAMIDDMKTAVFKDTPFKYHRTDAQGNRTVVDTGAA
jgi:cytolysin-activating lysine-acyltransferase